MTAPPINASPPGGGPQTPGSPPNGSANENLPEGAGETTARLLGTTIIGLFAYLGALIILLGQALRALRRLNIGDLVRQMSVIGVDSIPIALLTVGFSGGVLALYSVNSLGQFGVQSLVGGLVAASIVKETGPILSGVVSAARAGSAMTAEIGSMKVTEQIDALRSMAISPIEYLVTPRLVASLVMLPVVTVCADAAGVLGGAIVAASMGVPYQTYLQGIRQILWPDGSDIMKGLLKTVVFGILIALIGCHEGMESKGGAVGVGQSTTRSVVLSIVLIFIANFILSFLMFNGSILGGG